MFLDILNGTSDRCDGVSSGQSRSEVTVVKNRIYHPA